VSTAIQPEYWTPDEFARFAKLTTEQASKLRVTGGGPPFVKLGRNVRYLNLDVLRWTRERATTSTKKES
jgi:molybdenum cofactor biosynthesis enzyme MoaA